MTVLRPFAIGGYRFEPGAVLAPMAGITNPPFRRLCYELGAAYCVTELISCHAVVYCAQKERNRVRKLGQKTLSLLESDGTAGLHVVQLYGKEPDLMAQAAAIVCDMGADMVDLNFGCPARKVVKNGEGAGVALMRRPDLLEEIAAAVVAASRVPVTAKIRLGYGPGEKNALEVVARLERAGVQAVTVHARTRDQGHSGPVDLDLLAAIVASTRLPVIGNGGIYTVEDAVRMTERTGCATVAVGQGAKGNPWLFSQLAAGNSGEPSLAERIAVCRRHLDAYVDWAGPQRAVLEMRKHACWYLKGFDGAAAFRRRLAEAVSPAAFHALLDEVAAAAGSQ